MTTTSDYTGWGGTQSNVKTSETHNDHVWWDDARQSSIVVDTVLGSSPRMTSHGRGVQHLGGLDLDSQL